MSSRRYKVKKTAQVAGKEEVKDFIEKPEVLVEQFSKTEAFFQKHKNLSLGILGAIILVVGGFLGYRYYLSSQNDIAQREIFQAVFYFEQDSLTQALNGDGLNFGLLDIIADYGSTDAGNLANFYAGASYLKLGEFDNAIDYLKSFKSSDLLVQARTYALMGDAYMELGNYSDAATYYDRASNYKPNKNITSQYLMKAAMAYEKQSDFTTAIARYDKILTDHFGSSEYQNARKYKARLETLASP
jgi:tetratricopeptide (TPR) repeat protein